MLFWKEHPRLRISLILLFFIAGIVLVVLGWLMTGKLAGLGIMLLGVVLLLTSLMVYNRRFQDPRPGKRL